MEDSMVIFLGQFTYFSKIGLSCIDYAIIEHILLSKVIDFIVHPPNHLSDHSIITLNLNLKLNMKLTSDPVNILKDLPPNYRFNETTKVVFENFISSDYFKHQINDTLNIPKNVSNESIDQMNDSITELLTKAGKACLGPKAKCQTKHSIRARQKRLPKNLEHLKCEIKSLGKALAAQPFNKTLLVALANKRKQFNNGVKAAKNKTKRELLTKIESLEKTDPKQYWNMINGLRQKKQSGQEINPEDFFNFFKDLNNLKEKSTNQVFEQTINNKINDLIKSNDTNDILDKKITVEETKKVLKSLKNCKSPGLDYIVNEMLKYGSDLLCEPLTLLFNCVMDKSYYPSSWVSGIIIPLFKSGNHLDPQNYRGITLSSCLGKVFNKILNNRLGKYIEDRNIIKSNQIGFMPNRQTSDPYFCTQNHYRFI